MTSCRPVMDRASLMAVSLASAPLSPRRTRSRPAGAISTQGLLERDALLADAKADETWLIRRDLVLDRGHDVGVASGRRSRPRSWRPGRRTRCRRGPRAWRRAPRRRRAGRRAAGSRSGALDRAHPLDDRAGRRSRVGRHDARAGRGLGRSWLDARRRGGRRRRPATPSNSIVGSMTRPSRWTSHSTRPPYSLAESPRAMWTVPNAFLASVMSSPIRAAGLSPMPISPMLSASTVSSTIRRSRSAGGSALERDGATVADGDRERSVERAQVRGHAFPNDDTVRCPFDRWQRDLAAGEGRDFARVAADAGQPGLGSRPSRSRSGPCRPAT